MKNHDESKDVRILSRKMKIDTHNKTIQASKSTIIGNTSWGRIDFLTHYCGYHFIWNNDAYAPTTWIDKDGNESNKRFQKKDNKAPKLTDKRRKR